MLLEEQHLGVGYDLVMICLPCCDKGEEKNGETNDGDVQAILFAFEMVKTVD